MTLSRGRRSNETVLLWGCIAIALILLFGRGVPRLARWTGEARARDAAARLERTRVMSDIHFMSRVGDTVRARRQALERELHSLLHGATTGAMSADFAEFIGLSADDAGIHLGAIDVRADTGGVGSFARVTARADVTGDLVGITTFLATLEAGDRRVAVRELSISGGASGTSAESGNELRAALVLEGLALRPTQPRLISGGH